MASLGQKAAFAAALMSVFLSTGAVLAAGGTNVIAQAGAARQEIAQCSATRQGQELVDCVGDTMDRLSSNINRGEAAARHSEIISIAAQAAGIRGKPKAEARRVLNRLIGVARDLGAKSGDFGPAYNAIAGVFAHGVSAIERKG
jgi:hypothetical protein